MNSVFLFHKSQGIKHRIFWPQTLGIGDFRTAQTSHKHLLLPSLIVYIVSMFVHFYRAHFAEMMGI